MICLDAPMASRHLQEQLAHSSLGYQRLETGVASHWMHEICGGGIWHDRYRDTLLSELSTTNSFLFMILWRCGGRCVTLTRGLHMQMPHSVRTQCRTDFFPDIGPPQWHHRVLGGGRPKWAASCSFTSTGQNSLFKSSTKQTSVVIWEHWLAIRDH